MRRILPEDKSNDKLLFPARKIILFTYGRSGSSFTSAIIQRHPDIFYTFEPLYNLLRRTIGLQEGRNHFWLPNNSREQFDKSSIQIIQAFLNCSFESVDIQDVDNYQLRNSLDSRLLWKCIHIPKMTAKEALECFLKTRKDCLGHRVRMVKTIRMTGSAAARMMASHKDLRILYLIRDPRGTITSQKRVFGNFEWDKVDAFSKNFCRTFQSDLNDLEPLFVAYPGRIKLLRYETLAEAPMKVSQEMYEFLQLNFTRDVYEFVYNKTSAGQKSMHSYSTTRANSSTAAYTWRSFLPLHHAKVIDKNCQYVYDKLGYLPVTSLEELRSTNHSLKLDDVIFKGVRI
ncbi:carbohydrate sulfotransferase 1-like [Pomacea canaliculata]|uniref:carbohydrate sulfotransferase 1-like n=1 Tax=Pomacea canaliculata TaxID=400727 RepID=UPI000D72E9D2|nr:carbohydrate sulfotransferase 1-like [Pomacea canaliculata]